jgi:gas vesicle protein
MEYSITRALAELKLLDKKIIKATKGLTVAVDKLKRDKNIEKIESFKRDQKANYDSINDLIARKTLIKAKIVESNANTYVKINDVSMTVSEAIEKKSEIQYKKELLAVIKSTYVNVKDKVENYNERINRNLQNLLETHFGKDTKVNENDIKVIAEPYLQQNEYEILEALDCEKVIKELTEEIDNFENEVDYVLSESNTLTKIKI